MGVATGFVSPIRSAAYMNLQLNAGAFLLDFDYSSYANANELRNALATALKDETKILGVTRGGGTFVVQPEIRDPDADGKRYRFKGGAFVDSVDAQLTGTLLELRPEVFAKIMATGDCVTSGKKTTITMHTAIKESDYIPSLLWVGDMSDGGVVLIELKNALNNNGVTLTFADKDEGTVPFEFHAYQANVEDYDTAPFRVVFLDKLESHEMTVVPEITVVEKDANAWLTAKVYDSVGGGAWSVTSADATVAAKVSGSSNTVVTEHDGIVTLEQKISGVAVGTTSFAITYEPASYATDPTTAVTAYAYVRVVAAS